VNASSELLEEIRRAGAPPAHVAVIMDGNGRWAAQRSRGREFGHRAGIIASRSAVQAALDAGVGVLTLFAFSEENWQRPHGEVSALMSALELNLRRDPLDELRRRGVSLGVLGDLSRLPARQQTAIDRLVEGTRGGDRLRLNLAVSYGARAEIVRAARRLAERVERGTLTAGEIDESLFRANLYTAELPDPDLLIRTSGELRISNFMLWQIAYTELYVTPVLWPDFREAHFLEAIRDYQRRERRFGLTPARGASPS
jgi:undecaprenyl diphosphate synthase